MKAAHRHRRPVPVDLEPEPEPVHRGRDHFHPAEIEARIQSHLAVIARRLGRPKL